MFLLIDFFSYFFLLKKIFFFNLAALGLSCSMQTLSHDLLDLVP